VITAASAQIPEQKPRIGADRRGKYLNIENGRKCSGDRLRLSCLTLNKGRKLTNQTKRARLNTFIKGEVMDDKDVKNLLKLAIAAVGFKVVYDILGEEQREVHPDTWETDIVDEYYDGRLAGIGPPQRKLAAKYRVSQNEVSRTIREARRDVWENWDWGRADKDYQGEVERVAESTGLETSTVSAIVALNENFTVRRRRRSDAEPDRARQGKLI